MLCMQIVECRRVLKWTYAYGYYLPDHEHAKRQFFEYLQGMSFSTSLNQTLYLDLLCSIWNLFLMQVRLSLGWSDFINVQRRSCKLTSMQRVHQRISTSSAQNLLDWPGDFLQKISLEILCLDKLAQLRINVIQDSLELEDIGKSLVRYWEGERINGVR
jgi:hypothetical protein